MIFKKEWELIRLTPDYDIKPFDCGDHDLNGFLFEDARNYTRSLLAVTYILQDKEQTIAYFNYLNDKISHRDIGGNLAKFEARVGIHLPIDKSDMKSYPAVKIGRLGVHKDFQEQGIGKGLLDYTKNSFTSNNKTGCKFITVDAYQKSVPFYLKNGFKCLSSQDRKSPTRLMYFNLEAIS